MPSTFKGEADFTSGILRAYLLGAVRECSVKVRIEGVALVASPGPTGRQSSAQGI
jgi:hypothetical protein